MQRDRPGTVVRYTLEVVVDDFGLVGSIGTDVLTNAVTNTRAQLYAMLGVTPMIGRNDTGPIFSIADGQKSVTWALVTWAGQNHVGRAVSIL